MQFAEGSNPNTVKESYVKELELHFIHCIKYRLKGKVGADVYNLGLLSCEDQKMVKRYNQHIARNVGR